MAHITLAAALTLVCDPSAFLGFYHAVRTGAFDPMKPGAWLRRDGGKVYAERRGCLVILTTAGY